MFLQGTHLKPPSASLDVLPNDSEAISDSREPEIATPPDAVFPTINNLNLTRISLRQYLTSVLSKLNLIVQSISSLQDRYIYNRHRSSHTGLHQDKSLGSESIIPIDRTYVTLNYAYSGRVLYCKHDTATEITIPANLDVGFSCDIIQASTGQIILRSNRIEVRDPFNIASKHGVGHSYSLFSPVKGVCVVRSSLCVIPAI